MAPHSSTLAWKIPWTEEPGRLQSVGSLRVRHDWAASLFHFSLSCIGEGNGNPLQCSCLESPRDGAAWWAAVYGVTQSRTRLRWLSNSREAWRAAVHGIAKSWTRLSDWTELNWGCRKFLKAKQFILFCSYSVPWHVFLLIQQCLLMNQGAGWRWSKVQTCRYKY